MSGRTAPATGRAAAEDELLAQLGLPTSASPEDVDQLHQAVSEYLSAAPSSIRGWAHAQVAALDAAYLKLTDPVGLEGSALMSPMRPPTVVPGGPATPPARRGPAPEAAVPAAQVAAVTAAQVAADEQDEGEPDGEPDAEELAALYASVTPSVHADMLPSTEPHKTKRQRREARRTAAVAAAPVAAAPAGTNWWKRITLAGAAVIVVFAIGFGANQLVNGHGTVAGPLANAPAAPTQQAPSVDQAKVAALMQTYSADPQDIETLLALGDEFYFGTQYAVAGTWYDKVLAIDPKNITALNAQGAVLYNTQDLKGAEKTWLLALGVDPNNVEAHFNLGFLYMNQNPPDFAGVQREWNIVIALDPSGQFAQVAKAHLDSLAAASMLPAASGAPAAAPSGTPAASPAASSAPSPAVSPAASAQP